MFRSKRSSLAKRLWKRRITRSAAIEPCNEDPRPLLGPIGGDGQVANTAHDDTDGSQLESCLQSMLKRLKETQLKSLFRAIDSKGGHVSDCVLFPKEAIRIGRRLTEPHVLCCQVWRWPQVRHTSDIKPLLWCQCSSTDPIYVCINPYHWTQICGTDPSPPPYHSVCPHRTDSSMSDTTALINSTLCQQLSPVDRTMSTILSNETLGSLRYEFNSHLTGIQSPEGCRHWCALAYWELRNRVGRLFPVYGDGINIFSHLPQGEGLWLEQWFGASISTKDESVRRTRDKIGFGVTISREEDCVWVYNRSNHPIFVNSPTLDPPNTRNLTVYKVLPGFSIKVFDFQIAKNYGRLRSYEPMDGPMDQNAFRISFAKGWGPDYSRQFITSCPCWLEVLLSVTDKVKQSITHFINS